MAYLVIHDCKVPLKSLVTVKQCLGANEVFAIVLRGELGLLLLDPLDGFSHIPVRHPYELQQKKIADLPEQTEPTARSNLIYPAR